MSLHFAVFFFFNDTATTEIYTLSLHDALPISRLQRQASRRRRGGHRCRCAWPFESRRRAPSASSDRTPRPCRDLPQQEQGVSPTPEGVRRFRRGAFRSWTGCSEATRRRGETVRFEPRSDGMNNEPGLLRGHRLDVLDILHI